MLVYVLLFYVWLGKWKKANGIIQKLFGIRSHSFFGCSQIPLYYTLEIEFDAHALM